MGTYVRAAALRHRIVVVDGLKEHSHESSKALAAVLNQLAILAHEGHISVANLDRIYAALEKNYIGLCALAGQERC